MDRWEMKSRGIEETANVSDRNYEKVFLKMQIFSNFPEGFHKSVTDFGNFNPSYPAPFLLLFFYAFQQTSFVIHIL